MVLMRNLRLLFLLIVFSVSSVCASINFGSRNSAIKIKENTTLQVLSSSDMIVTDGTISKENLTAEISGGNIAFTRGILEGEDTDSLLTAQYLTIGGYNSLGLNGSKSVRAEPGTIYQTVQVSGAYNRIEGQPLFRENISLFDVNTTLTLALQSRLNKNISLNLGTLQLDDDLKLADGVQLTDEGIIYVNGRQVVFGGQSVCWQGPLTWNNAGDLVMNSSIDLQTTWTFNGENHITGNGNILDLSHSGTLWIRHNSTLHLRDIKIKGLGNAGKIIFEDASSQLRLSDAEIEMDADYNVTEGGWYVDGESTVDVKNWILTFDTRGSLTVDGTCLWYDLLRQEDHVPTIVGIAPHEQDDLDQQYITYLNDGIIRQVIGGEHGPVIWSGVDYLHEDLWLSPDKRVIVTDDKVVFGRSHSIHFSRTSDTIYQAPLLEVTSGKTLTLLNVVLENFHPDVVGSGVASQGLASDATISFSDKTTIELAVDCDLNWTWTFYGDCVLKGKGNTLKLGQAGAIVVHSSEKPDGRSTLLLDDIEIEGISGNKIRCFDSVCTLSFNNVTWVQDADYTFSVGRFDVIGGLKMTGDGAFIYETNLTSTIFEDSSIILDTGFTFSYAPSVGMRKLIWMQDSTSRLYMNGAALRTTSTGMQLTNGTLIIDHKNYLYNTDADGTSRTHLDWGIAFGDGILANDLNIIMMPAANIELMVGYLDYKNVS